MPGLEMRYFVLRPKSKNADDSHAIASRCAIEAYADAIEETNPDFAADLRGWMAREEAYTQRLRELEAP